ncbi:OprD family outer membrane porin, partial [Pseudomonas aeruginosa]|nr:OprD family outer membrane porin [Pseudomonas aeruginosa]
MTQPNSTSGSDDFYKQFYTGRRIDFRRGSPTPAATTRPSSTGSVSFYGSRQKDAWDQYYAGNESTIRWTTSCPCSAAPTTTRSRTRGRQVMGELDNDIWSVRGGFAYGPHQVLLSYQRNNGDDDFDYLRHDRLHLPGQLDPVQRLQLRSRNVADVYDLDMAAFGVPGPSFMTCQVRGWTPIIWNAATASTCAPTPATRRSNQAAGNATRRSSTWCRAARQTWRSACQATVRSDSFESDLDEVRLIVEYPAVSLKARRRPVRGGARDSLLKASGGGAATFLWVGGPKGGSWPRCSGLPVGAATRTSPRHSYMPPGAPRTPWQPRLRAPRSQPSGSRHGLVDLGGRRRCDRCPPSSPSTNRTRRPS